jgi:teichuronic acid biosynthesis glycosyltransferase TuaG
MHIADCIESVQSQSYTNWELIIVDGMSKDKTISIIQSYQQKDNRIRLISNENDNGPAQARAVGIKVSIGSYIAFIDSDDMWLKDKLEVQINFMINNNYKFSYTRYLKMYIDGSISKASIGGHDSNSFNQYLRRRGIANSTVMLSRECIDEEVLNTVGKSHGEDTLWWLLILRKGYKAYAIQTALAVYRVVDGSLSSKVLNNQFTVWHSYRNELGLNIFKASFNYIGYVLDVFIRRLEFFILNTLKK